MKTSLGDSNWLDHCAGEELLLVGSELQCIAHPYVIVVTLADGLEYSFSFEEVDTQAAKLYIKTDIPGAELRARVGV